MELATRPIPAPDAQGGPFVIARLNPRNGDETMLFFDRDGDKIYWTALLRQAAAFDSLAKAKPVSREVNGWVLPLALAECLGGLTA